MREYRFIEATPLIEFLNKYQDKIIGNLIKNLYIDFWPNYGRYSLADSPVVFELVDCFVVIGYLIPSDIRCGVNM